MLRTAGAAGGGAAGEGVLVAVTRVKGTVLLRARFVVFVGGRGDVVAGWARSRGGEGRMVLHRCGFGVRAVGSLLRA